MRPRAMAQAAADTGLRPGFAFPRYAVSTRGRWLWEGLANERFVSAAKLPPRVARTYASRSACARPAATRQTGKHATLPVGLGRRSTQRVRGFRPVVP